MSSTIGVTESHPFADTADRSPNKPKSRGLLIIVGILSAVVIAGALLSYKCWPFSENAVRDDLAEASDSTVTIRHYHPTYFPPGCILEGVEFRHGANNFKLIMIDKLVVKGSYLGIFTRHVPRITAIGARVFVPPFGANVQFHSQHSEIVVDELIANGSGVAFMSEGQQIPSLLFDVQEAMFRSVRWGSPIQYRLKFHNPTPPGEVSAEGKFGAWADGHPQDTPMSGNYTLEHADLGVYGGIGGILTSKGKFDGVFKHINVSGTTETPDFVVTSGGNKHSLSTHFDAYVDAMRGDTYLNRVEAHLGRTTLIAHGAIAESGETKGKVADLHFTSRRGRIEDILGLFVTAPRSPMSGDLAFITRARFARNGRPFLERVMLQAKFGIDDGSFKPETQKDVDALSAGARGQNKDDPETALSDLKGATDLSGGVAQLQNLDFSVPGANAHLHGTYNVVTHRINLHGEMKVDTKISKTSSGAKALLLKIMDPFFRKKKKGEVVPVHILGTYEKPQFGLDFGNQNQNTK